MLGTRILKAIGGTLAALALTTAPAYAGTAASTGSPPEVGVAACGWDPDAFGAYYNHCNSSVWVWIRVERHLGLPGFDRCVPPGRTYLGSTSDVRYAWYKGSTC
ncbi:DUF6355 family natural product biosynthesis protein [Nonomuraea sp. NPDC050783]|uniref:DUF6355 family natural product biosynthesis protein n=1 Tax=Nonomuraea sp. NPDC050783 TaxID=3154634 RepID=UPI003467E4A1